MTFRIREREEKRKETLASEKKELVELEAALFKTLKAEEEKADLEFIQKINGIHQLLRTGEDARELAGKLKGQMEEQGRRPDFHQKLLASVILELL